MQFTQNAAVYAADGQDIGRVDRVVIDPRTKAITHLVVRQGWLFTEDKVVPMHLVATTTSERVDLRANADELDDLPDYEATYYVASDGELRADFPADVPPALYPYPPMIASNLGGATIVHDPTPNVGVVHTDRNIPDETVALKEGARVVSRHDEHIGSVERVFTTADSGKVTHFVIAQGLLMRTRKLVPADWVETISEDEIRLAVSADFLHDLREYQEA